MTTRALAIALLLAASTARADVATTLEVAKAQFHLGVEQYAKGRYAAALAEFEGSYRLNPAPGVLSNIALTQKALKRYREALTTFERYQAEASIHGGIPQAHKEEIDRLIAETKAMLSILSITTTPAAEVHVDGASLGVSPIAAAVLEPGRHHIEISAAGYQEQRAELATQAGRSYTLKYSLSPVSAPNVAVAPAPALVAPPTVATESTPAPSHPSAFARFARFVRSPRGIATFALAGLSVASFAVAIGTGVDSESLRGDYDRTCNAGHCDQSKYDSGHTLALSSDIFIGVGSAAAVAAVLVAVIPQRKNAFAVTPTVSAAAGGLSVAGRF